MAMNEPGVQRWRHWAVGGIAALLAVYLAIAAHWTSRDLVWSFWFTTLSSGIFLIAAPIIVIGIAVAFGPDAKIEERRTLFFVFAALIAVLTLILVVTHLFFFQFVDGLVPPIYARERITAIYKGSRMISDAQSLPVYYLFSLAAAANAYWQIALLTLVCDIVALPWSLAGWRGSKPFSAVPMLGERIGKLMVIQGVVLALSMAEAMQHSIAVAVLVIAINFVPAGTFATLLGETSDGGKPKGAQ